MGKNIDRISLKTIAFLFPVGSMERIYLHGKWQIERGRNPSMTFGNHQTARDAYVTINDMLGSYFDEVRHQEYSRHRFFWSDNIITSIQKKKPVSELRLPCAYRPI